MGTMSNMYVEELKKFCSSLNAEEKIKIIENKVIEGINPENGNVSLVKDGKRKQIFVRDLYKFDFDKFEMKEEEKQIDNINSLDVLVNQAKIEEEIESLDETVINEKKLITLEDVSQSIAKKDEKSIDKALEEFAIDSTGKININKAIKVVTDNSADNVIECIRDSKKLPTSLSSYDITGKCIIEKENVETNEPEDLINSSFNNILVYVDAAKLKNISFTEEQMKNAKDKYKTQVNDKLNVMGLNKPKEENKVIDLESKKQEKQMLLELKPDTNIKRAGFADIIILTIIVLVYAAIIINLIMKIN